MNIRKLLATAMIVMITLAGCSKSDPEEKPEIKIPTPTVTLPTHEVGSASVTFTTTTAWTLSLSDTRAVPGWFTVDKTSGGAGTHTLTISITEANPSSTQTRTGYIQIVSGDVTQTITLTQPKAAVIAVTEVILNKTTALLLVGDTETLTATVNPSDAINKKVTWSSSNIAVATVSPSGVVTAKGPGSATITVTTTEGGKTAICTVTVQPIRVTDVTMDKTTAPLSLGNTGILTATITPANATDKSVTWSSSDATIVSVSSAGAVKGLKSGKATITVTTTDGSKTATCIITVIDDINTEGLVVDSWGNAINLGGGEAEK